MELRQVERDQPYAVGRARILMRNWFTGHAPRLYLQSLCPRRLPPVHRSKTSQSASRWIKTVIRVQVRCQLARSARSHQNDAHGEDEELGSVRPEAFSRCSIASALVFG